MRHKREKIIIAGAGIAGNTLAISMHRLGHEVLVIEKGVDPEAILQGQGKSINLAASARALEYFEQNDISVPKMVAMKARTIHTDSGNQQQIYDQFERVLQSINRNDLNAQLYRQAKALGVQYAFNAEVSSIDFDQQVVRYKKSGADEHVRYDCLMGADGSNSKVAACLDQKHGDDYQAVTRSPWVYQEYTINPVDNEFALADAENFHIWPGKDMFLIALPNSDYTFTVTLFAQNEAAERLKHCKKENDIEGVAAIFAELAKTTPLELFNIEEHFMANNVSHIYARDSRYWVEDAEDPHVLLIGDAAHAFPPFLGLGFNSVVEDVCVLESLIKKQPSLQQSIKEFARKRPLDMRALSEASVANAKILSEEVADPHKPIKFALTQYLEREFKNQFIDPHTMYSFLHMSEYEARCRQLWQEDILEELVADTGTQQHFKAMSLAKICSELDKMLHEASLPMAIQLLDQIKGLMLQFGERHAKWHQEHDDQVIPSPLYQSEACQFFKSKHVTTEQDSSVESKLVVHK